MPSHKIAGVLALTVFNSTFALGQQVEEVNESPTQAPSTLEKPYEVVITGRPTKSRLRDLIQKVEDDFFAKFTELNEDDYYDMYCYEYTPTMSHIKKRACEPLFMIRRRAASGADIAFAFGASGLGTGGHSFNNGAVGGLYNESPLEMRKNMRRDYDILTQKMEELISSNEELGEIASVMEQLKYRLENYDDNQD